MKTLLVGDLHGRVDLVEKAFEMNLPIVFLGDYLDSFTASVADQILTLTKVLDACEEREGVSALYGNHEWSYLDDRMVCSGWNAATQAHINVLNSRMYKILQSYVWAEGFLVSHAGVSQKLLDIEGITLEEYLEKGEFNQIGRSRGGVSPCGGLYWCDFQREMVSLDDGTKQVVGHTRGKGIRQEGGVTCIDCLEAGDPQFVIIDDGKIDILDVDW